MRSLRTVTLVALLALTACADSLGVRHVGMQQAREARLVNAVTASEISADSIVVLERSELLDDWSDDPARALEELHAKAVEGYRRARVYALAELCLIHAERTQSRAHYLGAAVYAHLCLFDSMNRPAPGPYDGRRRVLCEIYNQGLAGAFRCERADLFDPRPGRRAIPGGEVWVEIDDRTITLSGTRFDQFTIADELSTTGLRARIRRPGLGAPLLAAQEEGEAADDRRSEEGYEYFPDRIRVPVTAIMDVHGGVDDIGRGTLWVSIDYHSPWDTTEVSVRGQSVPLEADASAPLAASLGTEQFSEFELGALLRPSGFSEGDSLLMLQPYARGKIPVVLVHGTASSPARWAELLNEMYAHPELTERYQFWLFMYSSGRSVLTSAGSLRRTLGEVLGDLDPSGSDAALRRMVVVGHSQGGLLTRMLVTDGGNRFWEATAKVPYEDLDLTEEEDVLLRRVAFPTPAAYVERVVFICTPHRGSFLAQGVLRAIARKLMTMPTESREFLLALGERNPDMFDHFDPDSVPSAVDQMSPDNWFLRALEQSPMPRRVKRHSIIAVKGSGPAEAGDDGVVTYESAHLDDVDSELVIRAAHSAQSEPATINELRRILHEHIGYEE